jgi:general secretion pathway protein J
MRTRGPQAGFTLIETLVATALFLVVIAALASLTGQWLPSWNHGFSRVQRAEQVALGIERIVSDLAAAVYVSPNASIKLPIFDGSELGVTFVRGAVGPNSRPGLEIVRLAEIASARGPVLARASAPFVPLEPDASVIARLKFTEPIVLVGSPLRVVFAYAGADRVWQPTWRGVERLPSAVRISVRNAISGEVLAVSSAVKVHVEVNAACINPRADDCSDKTKTPPAAAPATPTRNQ